MQGTRIQSVVHEDPTCGEATKPMCHNYWACALEPKNHDYWAHASRAHAQQGEKPMQWEARTAQPERSLCLPQLEKDCAATKNQHSQN